jgi:molybdopterin adenylyltransferase
MPTAIADCVDAVMPAVPHCIDLLEGTHLTTEESRVKAFRPKK